jgi:hypothetical protein
MTRIFPSPFGSRRIGAILLGSLLLVAALPGAVSGAAPTITAATGGTNLSADTALASPGTGTYTPLSGPSLDGTVANTIGAGTWTLTISGPFAFNPAAGTAALSGGGGCGTLSIGSGASVAAGSASVTTTGASTGTCSIVFSGLQVRPTLGAPATGSIDSTGLATGSGGALSEVPGAAILAFSVAPSPTTVTAGSNFTTSPTIHSEDRFHNPRTGDSITLATVPATSSPQCTANPVTTASGDAVFGNCHLNTAGSFVLRASGAGTSVDFGTAITVNPAAASKIVFTTQPSRGTPSSILSPQPVVAIQDAFNNTVPMSATVTITKSAGGSGGLVSCGPFATTTGVVSGSTCRIDAVGTGYTLTATDGTRTSVPTSAFDISDRLVFTTQPSGAVAGVVFTTQPVVEVRAGASTRSLNDSSTPVALSISSGPSGATLTCSPNTVTASAGIVSYVGSSCRLDKVGTYTLLASSSGLTSATSASFSVAAGPATKLGFTAQPTSGVTTQAFSVQPVIAVQDAGGNTVTTGTNSTATITLSLGAGAPSGAVLTCTGGLSKAAVGGVATFAGCSLNAAGTYTLVATATGLTASTSASFVVAAPVAAITLSNSAGVITWGSAVNLTIQFGTNGANKSFALQAARDGVSFVTIANLTTNAAGQATLTYRPATNLFYKVVFAGTLDLSAATSNTTRTVVRQIALLRPHHSSSTSIARNTSITFTTTVRPSRPELPAARVSFVLYRKVGSAWTLVTTRNVFIDSFGKASTTFKFTRAGSWYVRSIANPTSFNANSVWSPVELYVVR